MTQKLARKLPSLPNNIIFPQALRDAIPDHQPSAGRCLKLDSVDAQGAHTDRWGRRVQINFRVCETGKLTGVFDICADMEIEAARALAKLIQDAADQAETLPPARAWKIQ